MLVGLRECEARSNPELIQSQQGKSSSKTRSVTPHAKRACETVSDFEGNKHKHEVTRSGTGVLMLVGLRECEARSNPELIQSQQGKSSSKTRSVTPHAKHRNFYTGTGLQTEQERNPYK